MLTYAATPGTTLNKNDRKINQENDYRSVVGKVLYLTTTVASELCNACRELSRTLERAWKTCGIHEASKAKQDNVLN
jgi:hypothetical protein